MRLLNAIFINLLLLGSAPFIAAADDRVSVTEIAVRSYGIAWSTQTVDGETFSTYTAYDSLSRVRRIVYPVTGLTVEHSYNANGYLQTITEPVTGRTHWQANSRELDGQIYQMTVGSFLTTKTYDALGRVNAITTSGGVQSGTYTFDPIGNLLSRNDPAAGVAETFLYDALNRLTHVNSTQRTFYDALGNITNKEGVGSYSYTPGTHRVQSAGGNSYSYDLNGNVQTISGASPATLSYTAFNLPTQIQRNGNTLTYTYDGDHQRVKEIATGSVNRSTIYILAGSSPFFEKEVSAGQTKWKHYIGTPEGVKALIIIGGASPTDRTERYMHHDHLGSVIAISEGVVIQRRSFDAWGATVSGGSLFDRRGFTGHEHLDEVGLIHMNGRIYDPILGRFLQADPIIQSPYDLQSFNRYSYVLNNPLSLIDPTGFSWWTKWRKPILAIAVAAFIGGFDFTAFLTNGTFSWTAGANGFIGVVAGGFAAGGIQGGNLQSALYSAATAALFYGVGELSGVHDITREGGKVAFLGKEHIAQTIGHAAVGCASAAAQGGSCKAGAMSAGFAALAGPQLPENGVAQFAGRIAVGAIASKLGGGSYENGAITAAFAYLFNDAAAGCDEECELRAARAPLVDAAKVVPEIGANVVEEAGWFALGGAFGRMLGSIARWFGVGANATQKMAKVGELTPTHGKTMSNKQLDKLTKSLRAEGIKEPLTVTEHQGKLYILDGHHRALAAARAGILNVPINRVKLPYGAYKTPADLTYTPYPY